MRSAIAAIVILAAGIGSAGTLSERSTICGEFEALGWPKAERLWDDALTELLLVGARGDAGDRYYDLDLDGDKIEDVVTVICPASAMPADPCTLEASLS